MIRHPEWTTLHDILDLSEWDCFIGDRLGNDLFINDPERAGRLASAAEDGCDGSTHEEIIQDWRDFMDTLDIFVPEFDDEEDGSWDISYETEMAITKEIDDCEAYHEKQGTLNQQVG